MSETATFLETTRRERPRLLTSEFEQRRLGAQAMLFAVKGDRSYFIKETSSQEG